MSDIYYGGQAVIEGVMMRGPRHMAVAVRQPNGEIAIHDEPLTAKIYTSSIGKLPFVRGLALLWDALGLGTRALMWSAEVAMPNDERDSAAPDAEPVPFQSAAAWGTVITSILMAIGLFFLLPLLLTGLIDRWLETVILQPRALDVASNLVEGVIRLAFFLAYLIVIGRMEDIQRVFGYHGAEHKTIHAFEAGDELTPANVRKYSLLHPRCGTGFLLVVMVVSIFIFTLVPREPFWWRVASRILLVPVIASLSYELLRWSAARYHNPLVRTLIAPSLALQKLTTREPDDQMLAVAIRSLKTVLAKEGVAPAPVESAPEAVMGSTD